MGAHPLGVLVLIIVVEIFGAFVSALWQGNFSTGNEQKKYERRLKFKTIAVIIVTIVVWWYWRPIQRFFQEDRDTHYIEKIEEHRPK